MTVQPPLYLDITVRVFKRINPFPSVTDRVHRVALVVFGLAIFGLGLFLGARRKIVAEPPLPALVRAVRRLAEDINTDFEYILEHLGELNKERGKHLSEKITRFKCTILRDPENLAAHAMVENCENNLNGLRAQHAGLFLITVPPDGSCLFHSLCRAMQMLDRKLKMDHHGLRQLVVDEMKKNLTCDARLQKYIDDAIEAYVAAKKIEFNGRRATYDLLFSEGREVTTLLKELEEEETVLSFFEQPDLKYGAYLTRADMNRFFASVAEIYTFSRLYPNYRLEIERCFNNGERMKGLDPVFNEKGSRKIILVHKNGSHFDFEVR